MRAVALIAVETIMVIVVVIVVIIKIPVVVPIVVPVPVKSIVIRESKPAAVTPVVVKKVSGFVISVDLNVGQDDDAHTSCTLAGVVPAVAPRRALVHHAIHAVVRIPPSSLNSRFVTD